MAGGHISPTALKHLPAPVHHAYLTAFTATFLSWADTNGSITLEQAAEAAFQPLRDL